MALPNVIIERQNGALGGLLNSEDGVMGLILTGTNEGDVVAGTPVLVNSFAAFEALGVTEDGDNEWAYRQVKEFYDEAGDGVELYLLLVPDTMTVAQMCDKTNANGAKKLLDFAAGRIRVLGAMADPAAFTVTVTNGLDANVHTAVANMNALAVEYAGLQFPFWGIVGGTSFSGTASALTDYTLSNYDYTSCLIGDTVSGANACLGLLLGRIAIIPVQRKVSRIKTGAISSLTAFIHTTSAEKYTSTATIHDRGYITLRKVPRKNGFFFTGDPTCTATTSDYRFGARVRVMNKLQMIAYATYIEEVDGEVPIEADGKIDAAFAAYLQQQVLNQIKGLMTANANLSGASCFVDPVQNVLSTNEVVIVIKGTPVGYASVIRVKLSFANPAIS